MQLSVIHKTQYHYSSPLTQALQQLRLTPTDSPGQKVSNWRISMPGIENALQFNDAFGNITHLVSLNPNADILTIEASGDVETTDLSGVLGKMPGSVPARVFCRKTDLTGDNAGIRKLAGVMDKEDNLIAGLHALMQSVRETVSYKVGVTETHTPAADALSRGEGVCQDHAHIFISAVRHKGLPARYVSGYLLVDEVDTSEAHHAWAEVCLPDLGWVGFDVSNGVSPTDQHIRLSTGLDSRSAAPIRGVRWGGTEEKLEVQVDVAQGAAQQ
ncbi:MAG: transglutaminase family protein [Stappiaceae bacterium]